jgi:sugar O-acyltransferase (sialic acid O-acetyltransferase NeuD family)
MAKVVIFGIQDFAELAWYYLTQDSEHEVVAFTVNRQYLPPEKEFKNLPIIPFEEVEELYPVKDYCMFAPMSPKGMNKVRESVYQQIKSKGYTLISYISSKATMFNNSIGDNCFILEDNTIQPFTTIGNNVVLWSGNHIGHHSTIKDHVSFTSHVVMSGHCIIEPYCFFGVNSTLRDGITLAEGTLVAMGATVTKNTEPYGVYVGNPGKRLEKKLSTDLL